MKHKKIMILPLMAAIVCGLLLTNISFAGPDSYLSLELDKTSAKVGDIIKGTLKINNINNFNGFQVNIRYNPEILQAVDPDTGTAYTESTLPGKNTILLNSEYMPLPMVSNKPSEGILDFGRTYLQMDKYRQGNKPESTGILGVIGFKLLKNAATEIVFEDSGTLPNSLSGTLIFDWNATPLTSENYSVKQPPRINPSSSFEPLPSISPIPSSTAQSGTSPSVLASAPPSVSPTNAADSDKGDKSAENTSSEEKSSDIYLYAIIVLSVIAVVILVIIIILVTRKKR